MHPCHVVVEASKQQQHAIHTMARRTDPLGLHQGAPAAKELMLQLMSHCPQCPRELPLACPPRRWTPDHCQDLEHRIVPKLCQWSQRR